jgi:hypothetical protein
MFHQKDGFNVYKCNGTLREIKACVHFVLQ